MASYKIAQVRLFMDRIHDISTLKIRCLCYTSKALTTQNFRRKLHLVVHIIHSFMIYMLLLMFCVYFFKRNYQNFRESKLRNDPFDYYYYSQTNRIAWKYASFSVASNTATTTSPEHIKSKSFESLGNIFKWKRYVFVILLIRFISLFMNI